MVTYAGNFAEDKQGKFTKYYNEDGSYEITTDNTTRKEKHILNIGGSRYESDIIYVKNYTDATAKFLFFHKDYLGSILAITPLGESFCCPYRKFSFEPSTLQGIQKLLERWQRSGN